MVEMEKYFNGRFCNFNTCTKARSTRFDSKSGFKIISYTLVNYIVDQYYGLKGWSWNDYTTISVIVGETLI